MAKKWEVILWSTDVATVHVEADDEDAAGEAALLLDDIPWKVQESGVAGVKELAETDFVA